jgi:hypothetical protein
MGSRIPAIALLAAILIGGIAMAAEVSLVGTWELDVAKSKFSPGPAPKSATRVYTESADGEVLVQKTVGADGKEESFQSGPYKADGKSYPETGGSADSLSAKAVNARTWNFTVMKAGKVIETVHRVLSADGKTLTVHESGRDNSIHYDNTMVFMRQ